VTGIFDQRPIACEPMGMKDNAIQKNSEAF
jgi:hypothetical protein